MAERRWFPRPVHTVGELRELLNSIPDETILLLSSDAEGNEISRTQSARLCRTHPGYIALYEGQLLDFDDPEALRQQMPLCLTLYPQ